jgi:hypothetical protein
MILPVIHNLLHNPSFLSFNFNGSWSWEAVARVYGLVREEVMFELRPCMPRVDTEYYRAKLHFEVVIINRSFEDWKWPTS